MNRILDEIISNAHLLVERQMYEPITKTNPYLYNVSHLCITNRQLMGQIPPIDAGYLAFAYLNIFDLTDEPSVLPIYSSICLYYAEKGLTFGYIGRNENIPIHISTLNSVIILMNIGARSLCRTFARAQNMTPCNYIDFDNLDNLPIYVKQILLCEYSYFIEFEDALASEGLSIEEDRQMALRYNFIKQKMSQGFYEGISSKDLLYSKAKQIRKQVFEYIASKIEVGDIIFR